MITTMPTSSINVKSFLEDLIVAVNLTGRQWRMFRTLQVYQYNGKLSKNLLSVWQMPTFFVYFDAHTFKMKIYNQSPLEMHFLQYDINNGFLKRTKTTTK